MLLCLIELLMGPPKKQVFETNYPATIRLQRRHPLREAQKTFARFMKTRLLSVF